MKNLIDKINIQQTITIIFLGAALIYSVALKNENIAMAVGSGLVGYLGGVSSSSDKVHSKGEE